MRCYLSIYGFAIGWGRVSSPTRCDMGVPLSHDQKLPPQFLILSKSWSAISNNLQKKTPYDPSFNPIDVSFCGQHMTILRSILRWTMRATKGLKGCIEKFVQLPCSCIMQILSPNSVILRFGGGKDCLIPNSSSSFLHKFVASFTQRSNSYQLSLVRFGPNEPIAQV